MFEAFKSFVARGNVIELAVGLMLGDAFSKIVNSLVNDVVMPPLGVLFGKVNFSGLYINLSGHHYSSLEEARKAGASTLNYGVFINTVVDFFIIAVVLFVAIHQLERLRGRQAVDQPTQTCPFCRSEIPLLATRCPRCTSDLTSEDSNEIT